MIPQIPKLGPGKDVATWAARVVDTLNPTLRSVLLAGGYRWSEVDGVNGAAPTFALQVAQRGGTWATVASFDSTGQIVQPAWQTPTLLNGWVNTGGVLMPAGYMRSTHGLVYLRGFVNGGTSNLTIFNLPPLYRPTATVTFRGYGESPLGTPVSANVHITKAGDITSDVGTGGPGVSFDGINFDVR